MLQFLLSYHDIVLVIYIVKVIVDISVIRGWLVRKHLNRLQNLKKLDYDSLSKGKQESRISKVKVHSFDT